MKGKIITARARVCVGVCGGCMCVGVVVCVVVGVCVCVCGVCVWCVFLCVWLLCV